MKPIRDEMKTVSCKRGLIASQYSAGLCKSKLCENSVRFISEKQLATESKGTPLFDQ